jgi:hypothetical protein
MRHYSVSVDEAPLADRAGGWLDKLEAAMDANGWDHRRPEARTLQRMDHELQQWRRAIRRGHHDAVSLQAQARVLGWLRPLESHLAGSHHDRRTHTLVLR